MNIADLIFLYAAEEKSISKAAARAYVSQQCASKHIQNLELKFGVPLIRRRPRFSLTEAGQALFASLQQIHMLESATAERIAELSGGSTGTLTLGINASRARLLLPAVLQTYRQHFPNVCVSVRCDDTARLTQLLLQGGVDLIIGVNSAADPRFHVTPLLTEPVYFVAGTQLLHDFLPDVGQDVSALSLQQIARLPLCMNLPGSTLAELLGRCAARQNVCLLPSFTTSDYGLQLAMCREGLFGFFCPASLLPGVYAVCGLRVFSVVGLQEQLHIECIRSSGTVQPAYAKAFEALLLKHCLAERQHSAF